LGDALVGELSGEPPLGEARGPPRATCNKWDTHFLLRKGAPCAVG